MSFAALRLRSLTVAEPSVNTLWVLVPKYSQDALKFGRGLLLYRRKCVKEMGRSSLVLDPWPIGDLNIWQLPEDASIPQAARLRVYPVAVSEGVVFVWMGDDPWGDGAKDILPVPSTGQNLDENKVTIRGSAMWKPKHVTSK